MAVPAHEAARRIERLSSALRECGFRLTHQRLEVVREVASTDAHPDAESVFRHVRERVPTISLDTVYRTLGTLADLGLIGRVAGEGGALRYDANTVRHHHFICSECGRIGDVECTDLDAMAVPAPVSAMGQVDSVEVRFRGVCRECAHRSDSDLRQTSRRVDSPHPVERKDPQGRPVARIDKPGSDGPSGPGPRGGIHE